MCLSHNWDKPYADHSVIVRESLSVYCWLFVSATQSTAFLFNDNSHNNNDIQLYFIIFYSAGLSIWSSIEWSYCIVPWEWEIFFSRFFIICLQTDFLFWLGWLACWLAGSLSGPTGWVESNSLTSTETHTWFYDRDLHKRKLFRIETKANGMLCIWVNQLNASQPVSRSESDRLPEWVNLL